MLILFPGLYFAAMKEEEEEESSRNKELNRRRFE
jgi:hypothetical protein